MANGPHFGTLVLRGRFVGLGRNHPATDRPGQCRKGCRFSEPAVMSRAEAVLERPVKETRVGGAANKSVRRQIKADICERPVVATHEHCRS